MPIMRLAVVRPALVACVALLLSACGGASFSKDELGLTPWSPAAMTARDQVDRSPLRRLIALGTVTFALDGSDSKSGADTLREGITTQLQNFSLLSPSESEARFSLAADFRAGDAPKVGRDDGLARGHYVLSERATGRRVWENTQETRYRSGGMGSYLAANILMAILLGGPAAGHGQPDSGTMAPALGQNVRLAVAALSGDAAVIAAAASEAGGAKVVPK